MKIIFCIREKNKKRIKLHRWFLNVFGTMPRQNVCALLDSGTRLEKQRHLSPSKEGV